MRDVESERWLRSKEAAEMIGIAPGTLANLRSQKRGPRYYKQGRRIVYRRSDVEKWMRLSPVETN